MRLHVVDGTFELFRAHFSKRPDRTSPDGRDVKATMGTVSSLLWLLADPDEAVTHVAVAFDNPIESWRNEVLATYKDSSGVDPALLAQFGAVERAVAAIGVTVWSMDRHEADDAMASAAERFADEVEQVRILTPDKDLGQVVRGRAVVQVDRMRQRSFDEDGIRERLGVWPQSVPDYLALVGDTADGIPGIPGFGAKSTAAVLDRFPHITDIPADGAQWDVDVRGASKLAQTLDSHRDEALAYRRLATLDTDVALGGDLEGLAWSGVPRERFLAWCDEVGADALREAPHRFAD